MLPLFVMVHLKALDLCARHLSLTVHITKSFEKQASTSTDLHHWDRDSVSVFCLFWGTVRVLVCEWTPVVETGHAIERRMRYHTAQLGVGTLPTAMHYSKGQSHVVMHTLAPGKGRCSEITSARLF